MKKRISKSICMLLAVVFIAAATAYGAGCKGDNKVKDNLSMREKLVDVVSDTGVWIDGQGNKVFSNHGIAGLMYGHEASYDPDLYGQALQSAIKSAIDAIKNMNGSHYNVLVSWSSVEREEGVYDFSGLEYAVQYARQSGIRLSINLFSLNVSAGSAFWTPDWLVKNKAKYNRMRILGYDDATLIYDGNNYEADGTSWSRSYITMCFNDPDTLAKEKAFITATAKKISELNTDGVINSVCYAAEPGYSRVWMTGDLHADYRCHCDDCNAKFRSSGHTDESRYEFMQRSGYDYYRANAQILRKELPDMALYGTYAGIYWAGGDRFLERPEYFFPGINVKNYFVVPSIMSTHDIREYTQEMDITVGKTEGYEVLKDNIPLAVGIDPGHVSSTDPWINSTHLELATWYNIFAYGGMGGVYCPHPNYNYLDQTSYVYQDCSIFWAPLKAAEFWIARFKTDRKVLDWWNYSDEQKEATLGNFTVKMERINSDGLGEYVNYGYMMLVGKEELAISGTRKRSSYSERISVELPSAASEWKVELGSYDKDGKWVLSSTLASGEYDAYGTEIVFQITRNNNNDASESIYRIVKK